MILYFTDRRIQVKGLASTNGASGLIILDDATHDSVKDGVKTLSVTIAYEADNFQQAEELTKPTNYILCEQNDEQLFFTIIESEINKLERTVEIYAEDSGLDMINDVVGDYNPTIPHSLSEYISKYIEGSGWELGNISTNTPAKVCAYNSEETAIQRLRAIAEDFNVELSFRVEIDRLTVTHKYIDAAQKRGTNNGVKLYLNREVENITIKKSAANVATALYCVGGMPEGAKRRINLKDYVKTSTDGDYYTPANDSRVYCHSALENYERLNWAENVEGHGNLVKRFEYDTVSKDELFEKACEELSKCKDLTITYDIEIKNLGDKNVNIGDTIYIVDDKDEIYLEARVLETERSYTQDSIQLVLGDYVQKEAGISDKVQELADKLAETAGQVANAQESAEDARYAADKALETAENVEVGARNLLLESYKRADATTSGIKREYLGNGVYRLYGTSTGAVDHALYVLYDVALDAGNYTVTCYGDLTKVKDVYVSTGTSAETELVHYLEGDHVTFALATGKRVRYIGIHIDSGVTLDVMIQVKLEKGNKSTDWTPAVEDVRESIDNAQSRADDAYSKAETAASNASAAMTSADGKNKVYHQATAPSGTSHKAHDLWFDTDDGNKIYRWNGSEWVANVLGENAIADLNARKITAGTIDASKVTVSNIDAGNITTGKVGAQHIDVGAIKIGELSGSIGGTNLLLESYKRSNSTVSGIQREYLGSNKYRIHGTSTAAVDMALYVNLDVGSGDFTLSCTGAKTKLKSLYITIGTTSGSGTSYSYTDSKTVNIASGNVIKYIGITIESGVTIDTTLQFKLERGTMATDWSPAPADMASNGKVDNMITTIDGGGIKIAEGGNNNEKITLDNNGMKIYKAGKEVANFGESVDLKFTGNNCHIQMASGGIVLYDNSRQAEAIFSDTLAERFVVEDVTIDGFSVNGGNSIALTTKSITKQGYRPIGVVGYRFTGTNLMYCNLFVHYLSASESGSGTITYRFRNTASTSTFTGSLIFSVLWIKEIL